MFLKVKDMSDSKCYIITGQNPKFLYKIGKFLETKDLKLFYGYNVPWEKDSKSIGVLQRISEYSNNKSERVYLVGSSFSNHIDYLDRSLDDELVVTCVHDDFESFFDSMLEDFEYKDNPFINDDLRNFPNYGFKSDFSLRDYFKKYFLDVRDKIDLVSGEHLLQWDFENKNKATGVIKSNFDLDIKEFSDFKSFLDYNYNLVDFIKQNIDNNSGTYSFLKSEDKKSILVNTFVRPSEFKLFQRQVYEFLHALVLYEERSSERTIDITWRVHLDLSDFYVDWNKSDIKKDYLYSGFYEMKGELSKYIDVEFSCFDEDIHGCNDLRRNSIEEYSDYYESFIWLDPDVIFPRKIFYCLNRFLIYIDENFDYYSCSPEFLYSESNYLDSLVSDKFIDDKRPSFQDISVVNDDKVSLSRVDKLPICGSFSLISTSFLDLSGIPEELGHYGNDDKYISECFQIFNDHKGDEEVVLYKLKDLVVTQIKEGVKEEEMFINYFNYNKNASEHKYKRHIETQNYLDVLYNEFKEKL